MSLLIKPLIVISVITLGSKLFPSAQGYFANTSIWIVLPVYIFIDDLMQYWYHRSGHEYDFLWKLHRSHHQAQEMGVFVSYRNAALYYLMMPNLWYLAVVIFLGGGFAVAVGLVIKQLIIITPAFHHGHHGKSKLDGISDPNGNFGNMFSILD